MTLVVELLEPALVQTTDDLLGLDPVQIRQVSLRLNPKDGSGQGVETKADPETTNLGELVSFMRAVQTEPSTVELWFQGRSESLNL
jgi:hypothetical protein